MTKNHLNKALRTLLYSLDDPPAIIAQRLVVLAHNLDARTTEDLVEELRTDIPKAFIPGERTKS